MSPYYPQYILHAGTVAYYSKIVPASVYVPQPVFLGNWNFVDLLHTNIANGISSITWISSKAVLLWNISDPLCVSSGSNFSLGSSRLTCTRRFAPPNNAVQHRKLKDTHYFEIINNSTLLSHLFFTEVKRETRPFTSPTMVAILDFTKN